MNFLDKYIARHNQVIVLKFIIFIPFILQPMIQMLNIAIENLRDINNNYIWSGIILLNVFLVLINTFRVHSKKKLRHIIKINFIR